MAYRQTQQENVFINGGKTLATWCTFLQGHSDHMAKMRVRYVVRAGKKGKGRVLAKATCPLGLWAQHSAKEKIAEKLGGVEFMDWVDEKNRAKFEAAGYISDPFERG